MLFNATEHRFSVIFVVRSVLFLSYMRVLAFTLLKIRIATKCSKRCVRECQPNAVSRNLSRLSVPRKSCEVAAYAIRYTAAKFMDFPIATGSPYYAPQSRKVGRPFKGGNQRSLALSSPNPRRSSRIKEHTHENDQTRYPNTRLYMRPLFCSDLSR